MIKNISISLKRSLLILMALLTLNSFGQIYPVQANLSTAGPYYNYLSYYADQNNHLQLVVTLTDFNANPVLARLRFKITGPGYEITTTTSTPVGQTFLLEPGIPNFINGIDLQDYFYQGNLLATPAGIDINNLPEGFTTICVDVIRDGVTAEVLSTNNCTSFFLEHFQPPQAFLPTCESSVDTNALFHTFQWSEPIGYVPSISSDLTYTFSLYEWNDPNNYTIFETGQGLVYTEQTNFAMVQISTFDVAFQPGKLYVWRVKAELSSNGMPVDMIENNGLSEPCTFTYGEVLTLEDALTDGLYIDLNVEGSSERKGRAYWSVIDNTPNVGLSTYSQFLVKYRKKPTGLENYTIEWFYDTVPSFNHFMYQLEGSTTYEVTVSGITGNVISDPTPVKEFTTPAPRNYACGDQDFPFMPASYTPLENALAGIQVQIGQFYMDVSEISPVGSLGHYSGKGTVKIPFIGGAKAKVRFDDIIIDTEYTVREGRVDMVTKGLDAWINEQYEQFVEPIYVDGTIDSAYVDTNGVAWVIVDGVSLEFNFDPPSYPIVVNDENGYQYIIWPNGTIEISVYLSVSETWDVDSNSVVVFSENSSDNRGFDGKEYMQWHENYEIMELSDSSYYFVANKSIAKNEAGSVDVSIPQGTQNLTFELANGINVPLSGSTLSIPAISSAGQNKIYAKTGGVTIGQLNLFVYSEKIKEVVIVPIASSSVSQGDIETALDATFGEANIDVSVTIANQWSDSSWNATSTVSLPSEVGLLNKYSDDMRGLRDAYFADSSATISEGAYYIFVISDFDDLNVDGYMVRGKALGFVSKLASAETYAHELAHGIGALEHSWKNNGPGEGTTNNLMDYNISTSELIKYQWKELRDFDLAPSLWDDIEDSEGNGGLVHYYAVKIDYTATNEERIVSRKYLGRYNWIKQGAIGSVTSTQGTYTTGVNKFFKQINGEWQPFRYEHFGKVFYMKEITNNEGVKVRYGTAYSSSNTLVKQLGESGEAADGIYQVTSMYLAGNGTPYVREVRNYELKPVIDHYRYGSSSRQKIYFNDLALSDQFREQLNKRSLGQMTYGDIVLWLESHPRRHSNELWNVAAQQSSETHLPGGTNDFQMGPVYPHYQSLCAIPHMPPFSYSAQTNETYIKGISAHLIIDKGAYWEREIVTVNPSGYYQSGADGNHIHAQYGASSCQHSLSGETHDINSLISKMSDPQYDAEDISEFISLKTTCFLYGLNLNKRKELLDLLISDDGSWVKNNQNILYKVVATTLSADQKLLLDYFKLNNSQKFRDLQVQLSEYFDFNDGQDLSVLFRVYGKLSKFIVSNAASFPSSSQTLELDFTPEAAYNPVTFTTDPVYEYKIDHPYYQFPIVVGATSGTVIDLGKIDGIPTTYGQNSGISITLEGNHTEYPLSLASNGNIRVLQHYKVEEFYDGIYFTTPGNTLADIPIYGLNNIYYLDPYAFVDVVIGENYGGAGYDKGDVLHVPAIMALLITQAIENDKFDQIFTRVVDLVEIVAGVGAVIAAPATGGGTLLAFAGVVESIAAAADIAISNYQNTLATEQYNDDFFKTWKNIKSVVDIGSGLIALPQLAIGAVKVGSGVMRYGRNLAMAVSLRRSVKITDFTNDLSTIYDLDRARTISRAFREGKVVGELANAGGKIFNNITDAVGSHIDDITTRLYRGDLRTPDEIFGSGFTAKGANSDIVDYVELNEPSIFIGTSKSPEEAFTKVSQAQTEGYVYVLGKNGNTTDVNNWYNSIEGYPNPYASELEVVFENAIPSSNIQGAFKINSSGDIIGDIIVNPNFVP